jgi:uncharacterized membrane protein YdbT with pleckstrin-like domain
MGQVNVNTPSGSDGGGSAAAIVLVVVVLIVLVLLVLWLTGVFNQPINVNVSSEMFKLLGI